MREIKFRGKHLDDGTWVYGNLLAVNNNFASIGEVGAELCHYKYSNVDPATVGQFTGLHEKDGVEIYEGDVLSSGYGKKGVRVS